MRKFIIVFLLFITTIGYSQECYNAYLSDINNNMNKKTLPGYDKAIDLCNELLANARDICESSLTDYQEKQLKSKKSECIDKIVDIYIGNMDTYMQNYTESSYKEALKLSEDLLRKYSLSDKQKELINNRLTTCNQVLNCYSALISEADDLTRQGNYSRSNTVLNNIEENCKIKPQNWQQEISKRIDINNRLKTSNIVPSPKPKTPWYKEKSEDNSVDFSLSIGTKIDNKILWGLQVGFEFFDTPFYFDLGLSSTFADVFVDSTQTSPNIYTSHTPYLLHLSGGYSMKYYTIVLGFGFCSVETQDSYEYYDYNQGLYTSNTDSYLNHYFFLRPSIYFKIPFSNLESHFILGINYNYVPANSKYSCIAFSIGFGF